MPGMTLSSAFSYCLTSRWTTTQKTIICERATCSHARCSTSHKPWPTPRGRSTRRALPSSQGASIDYNTNHFLDVRGNDEHKWRLPQHQPHEAVRVVGVGDRKKLLLFFSVAAKSQSIAYSWKRFLTPNIAIYWSRLSRFLRFLKMILDPDYAVQHRHTRTAHYLNACTAARSS